MNSRPKANRQVFVPLLAVFALAIAGYGIASYLTGHPLDAGFLQGKKHYQGFVASEGWTAALLVHVAGGSLALLAGAAQWLLTSRRWKNSRPSWYRGAHIVLGITYLAAIVAGGLGGLVLAPQAMGGLVAALGFGTLDLLWLVTTATAALFGARTLRHPEGRPSHRAWMVRSYALTSAAITLRLWMPLGALAGLDFVAAYTVIAWLCWVPNLLVAEWLVRRRPVPVGSV